jgi:rhodanese-related sulfurtransferase
MPASIGTDALQRLLDEGAQLVDVLGASEFEAEHLPGALNVPLSRLDRDRVASLDPNRPVVVYCFDYQ